MHASISTKEANREAAVVLLRGSADYGSMLTVVPLMKLKQMLPSLFTIALSRRIRQELSFHSLASAGAAANALRKSSMLEMLNAFTLVTPYSFLIVYLS